MQRMPPNTDATMHLGNRGFGCQVIHSVKLQTLQTHTDSVHGTLVHRVPQADRQTRVTLMCHTWDVDRQCNTNDAISLKSVTWATRSGPTR